jgi:hypothetical protein
MLDFVRKFYRLCLELLLLGNLVVCVVNGNDYIEGGYGWVVGIAVGVLVIILVGGYVANILEIVESVDDIKENIADIKKLIAINQDSSRSDNVWKA